MPKLGNLKLRTFVISQFLWVKNPDAAYLSVSGSKSLMNCQDVGWGYSLTWRLDWLWGMGGGGNGNICFQAHSHGCCPPPPIPDPLLKTASWHGNWLPPVWASWDRERQAPKMEASVFITLLWPLVCHISVRIDSKCPAHTQSKRIIQEHEY